MPRWRSKLECTHLLAQSSLWSLKLLIKHYLGRPNVIFGFTFSCDVASIPGIPSSDSATLCGQSVVGNLQSLGWGNFHCHRPPHRLHLLGFSSSFFWLLCWLKDIRQRFLYRTVINHLADVDFFCALWLFIQKAAVLNQISCSRFLSGLSFEVDNHLGMPFLKILISPYSKVGLLISPLHSPSNIGFLNRHSFL